MLGFLKGLGVGFLCLLLFVAGVIFNVEFLAKKSNENAIQLTRSIEAYTQIKPDIFTARIDFYSSEALSTKADLSDAERGQIAQVFKEILNRNAKDNFCVGGSYSLEANFAQEDGFKIPKGQNLKAHLACEIKAENLNAFNALVEDMNAIVAQSELVRMSTPALWANFSEDLLMANKEKLSDALLTKAYAYESAYSRDLNKTCTLTSLSLNTEHFMQARALRSDATLPLVGKKNQSASAKLALKCR